MAGQGRQGSGQGLPTYNAVPLVERERALLVPLPARNEEGWEKKVNPVKYLDPGPGPGVVPEAIISLDFDDVFTEEKDTTTRSEFKEAQQAIYKYSKLIYYNILSIFIGIPLSLMWGFINASALFVIVWMIYPTIKLAYVVLYPMIGGAYTITCSSWWAPFVDTCGRLLKQIHVNIKKN